MLLLGLQEAVVANNRVLETSDSMVTNSSHSSSNVEVTKGTCQERPH